MEKRRSVNFFIFNPIIIMVLGGMVFSSLVNIFSGHKTPTPSPTPTPVIASPTSTPTSEPTPEVKGEQSEEFLVTKIIDGDTIEIEGGKKVRYIGMDTPETVNPQKPVQCFGHEAAEKNKEWVLGKKIRMEKDISETDRYGRLLRYVWVGEFFVNEQLVRQGYAQVSTYPPDVKYQDLFLAAQKEARENNRGLWQGCSYFGEPQATSTPKPQPTQKPIPTSTSVLPTNPPLSTSNSGGYNCSANTYNCDDFQYQEDAQYVFQACGGPASDIHRLDGDKDGIVCETLPKRGGSSVQPTTPQTQNIQPPPSSSGGGYSCNCSKTCKQISSCDEAYFQLKNCGCSVRDGDGDGVPCEDLCH